MPPKVSSLSAPGHLAKTAHFGRWAPDALKGFQGLAEGAFSAGALSVADKEVIAFGCAHALRCPYCIDYHHGLAGKAGVTRGMLSESIWVAIAVAAHAPAAHASLAMRYFDGQVPDSFYEAGWEQDAQRFGALAPAAHGALLQLQVAAFAPGELTKDIKVLVAIACAHNIRCPFSIERYVTEARNSGISREAVSEAIFVAVEMAAGACVGHAGLAAALMED